MLSKNGSWGKELLSIFSFNTSLTDAWDLRSQWVFSPSQPSDHEFKHTFFHSVWMGFSDLYWEFIIEIIWKDIIKSCYFSFLFPSFVSKIQWFFQSHCGCKLKFHLDSASNIQHFCVCVSTSFIVKCFWETQEKWWKNTPVFLYKARQLDRGQATGHVHLIAAYRIGTAESQCSASKYQAQGEERRW